MTKSVYENPRYYEIAFSFRDISAEVDLFEACFREYASIPVKNVLEIACGQSPHLEEILRRGYTYTGLDISQAMLDHSTQKAAALEGKADFIQADMHHFSLPQPVEFAYIALGSLRAGSADEIHSHFQAVGQALKQGGLYLLDWCICFAPFISHEDSWVMEQENIKVCTHYSEKLVDAVEQLVEETIRLEVLEDGQTSTFTETSTRRVIYPQEFLQIIHQSKEWEFVGWWNNWNLEEPLDKIKDPKKISRPITLLRKK